MSDTPSQPVAGRFALLSLAGEGGMGTVWKARDLLTSQLVALKLLNLDVTQPDEVARFDREVSMLAELRHPGIVRYIAHGQLDSQAYLVMEWLEGQDLATRLAQKPLTATESGVLLRRVAQVLAVAHLHGIIHRDVKPSNLFLRYGRMEEATVLDFGVARRGLALQRVTRTGVVIGTPEYMAPEQARGLSSITPAADLFALGCVAFECLTGRPPFSAHHITGLLTKILFDPAPRLRQVHPEYPAALDELIAQLLEKDPLKRPQSASVVYERLSQINFSAISSPEASSEHPALHLSEHEQHLATIVLAAPPHGELQGLSTVDHLDLRRVREQHGPVLDQLTALGVLCEVLADGSLWATVVDSSSATDQVLRAAQAASLLRSEFPRWLVVMATGLCVLHDRQATGPALDLAQQLLSEALSDQLHCEILTDRLSAELLRDDYYLQPLPSGSQILGPAQTGPTGRHRKLPLIGRERELSLIFTALRCARDDEVSRSVLVLGSPGSGKTRLCEEVLARIHEAHEHCTILRTSIELTQAALPFATITGWLRCADSLLSDEPLPRPLWQAAIDQHYPAEEAERYRQTLQSLLRITPSRLPFGQRAETLPGSNAIGEAVRALLSSVSRRQPLLLIIDNMQWIDAASLAVLEATLQRLVDLPILLLGLARPEIDELLPRLFEGLPTDRVRLGRLSLKSADKLLEMFEVSPPSLREDLAHESLCRPLFLLRLAEGVRTPKSAAADAVVAMMQTRALRLEPTTRLVLRAASLLDGPFGESALFQLLPGQFSLSQLDRALDEAIDQEWLDRMRPTEVGGEACLRFRSPLQARAILATVTTRDREAFAKIKKRQAQAAENTETSDR